MAKIVVNGQEVTPAKKVKLDKHKTRMEIKELILKKQEELKSVKPSSN